VVFFVSVGLLVSLEDVNSHWAVIAKSLFLSPLWSGMPHYLVIRYRIHEPEALPSKPAEPE
jgi:Kef-type K+ transport system membrane component KefB